MFFQVAIFGQKEGEVLLLDFATDRGEGLLDFIFRGVCVCGFYYRGWGFLLRILV